MIKTAKTEKQPDTKRFGVFLFNQYYETLIEQRQTALNIIIDACEKLALDEENAVEIDRKDRANKNYAEINRELETLFTYNGREDEFIFDVLEAVQGA